MGIFFDRAEKQTMVEMCKKYPTPHTLSNHTQGSLCMDMQEETVSKYHTEMPLSLDWRCARINSVENRVALI